jgi:hypothetical protein
MPVIEIRDPDKFDKAVATLAKQGGAFSGREDYILVVSRQQLRALVKEGLAEPKDQGRGKKQTKNGGK